MLVHLLQERNPAQQLALLGLRRTSIDARPRGSMLVGWSAAAHPTLCAGLGDTYVCLSVARGLLYELPYHASECKDGAGVGD
jgi:hypothetical protein